MLYREALLEFGPVAASYVAELSRRQRARLGEEILGVYALYLRHGVDAVLAAMASATAQGAYGRASLQALLAPGAPVAASQAPAPARRAVPQRSWPWLTCRHKRRSIGR